LNLKKGLVHMNRCDKSIHILLTVSPQDTVHGYIDLVVWVIYKVPQ